MTDKESEYGHDIFSEYCLQMPVLAGGQFIKGIKRNYDRPWTSWGMMAEKNLNETIKSAETVKTVQMHYKTKDHDFARHGFVIINKVFGERRHERNDWRIDEIKKNAFSQVCWYGTLSLLLRVFYQRNEIILKGNDTDSLVKVAIKFPCKTTMRVLNTCPCHSNDRNNRAYLCTQALLKFYIKLAIKSKPKGNKKKAEGKINFSLCSKMKSN